MVTMIFTRTLSKKESKKPSPTPRVWILLLAAA